jgi:hypothetical protein
MRPAGVVQIERVIAQVRHGGDAEIDLLVDAMAKVRPEVEVEVQAIQVGPVVLVSNPAEYFGLPEQQTVIMGSQVDL